jgi:hypothetical protein
MLWVWHNIDNYDRKCAKDTWNIMINLCSLNVNGIHGREKRNMVVEWIKTQKCSIAFLQETQIFT